MIEKPDEREAMWALLGVYCENHERGIVLLGEEFERGCIFKRVDLIRLGELFRKRLFEQVEVCDSEFEDPADFVAFEEKGGLRVLDDMWFFLSELALRPSAFRFAA